MHLACKCNHIEIIRYLVAKGADIDSKNNNNHTPADVAKILGHISTYEELIKISKDESNNNLITNTNTITSLDAEELISKMCHYCMHGDIDGMKNMIATEINIYNPTCITGKIDTENVYV